MTSMGTVRFRDWSRCLQLDNGSAQVVAATEFGPRILSYRLIGGENIFAELGPDVVVKSVHGDCHLWGGHRLWHAPEVPERTYYPDELPVSVHHEADGSVRFVQTVEPHTRMEKSMSIRLGTGARVTVTHVLTNRGMWPVELAPWAPTIMRGGGVTILPNEPSLPESENVLPARSLSFWHYADLSDSRVSFGRKFIRLRTDAKRDSPFKMGAMDTLGWAAYLRGSTLFIKRFPFFENASYPDYGCNFETYTQADFMEVESLGPLTSLAPNKSVSHVERWYLFDGVRAGDSEDSLQEAIMPLVESTEPPERPT